MENIRQWCIEQAVKLGRMDYIADAKVIYKEVVGLDWGGAVPTGVMETKERYFEQKYGVKFIDVYRHGYRGDMMWITVEGQVNVERRAFIYSGYEPFDGNEIKFTMAKGSEMFNYKEYYTYELSPFFEPKRYEEGRKLRLMLSGMDYMEYMRQEWNSWGDDTMKMFIERVKRAIEDNEDGLEEKLRSEYRCESLKSYKQ